MTPSYYRNPLECKSWKLLTENHRKLQQTSLTELFHDSPDRANDYSIEIPGLLVDYSKNRFDAETLDCLFALADELQLAKQVESMFSGEHVNKTEDRPALHSCLRTTDSDLALDGQALAPLIEAELEKMELLSLRIRNGEMKGASGKAIDNIVHIGIGGSDLGPRMIVDALKFNCKNTIPCHFVANIDSQDIESVLRKSDPESTLFILASKSFTTLETLMNGKTAKTWLEQNNCKDVSKHFVAISSNIEAAVEFGIDENNILAFWSWVGGRYSVWSAIGLPIAISLGMESFRQLLQGASHMDTHFRATPSDHNIPVILGLLDIWYLNFFKTETLSVVPYDQSLQLLPDYLSQLIMESNGKSVDRNGQEINYTTAPIVWGSVGSNGQHAFFQLLHQGTQMIPVEFLIGCRPGNEQREHHDALLSNCLAQSEALMQGQVSAKDEPWRNFTGNRPSTTIMYDELDAETLGSLLAMYEHRTYVQACILNINAFDQWGVELGKKLTGNILGEIQATTAATGHDASTRQLLDHYIKTRNS